MTATVFLPFSALLLTVNHQWGYCSMGKCSLTFYGFVAVRS